MLNACCSSVTFHFHNGAELAEAIGNWAKPERKRVLRTWRKRRYYTNLIYLEYMDLIK